jgi:CheY-like chemotaxis protein
MGSPMRDSTIHFLLVEDDEVDVMTMERAFEKSGVSDPLFVARTGVQAFEMLQDNAVPNTRRVVLLDLNMPGMNGIEFLRKLRADPALRVTPVVVITTSTHRRDLERAYELNVAGYLVKPVTFAKFVEVVKRLDAYWRTVEMPR